MKISGATPLPFTQEVAYRLLQDPAVLCRCMPGCESLEKTGEDEYAMRKKMLQPAISGKFDGKVRITEPQPPSQFRLHVEGSGKIGFMKGNGLITLTPAESGCGLSFDGEEGRRWHDRVGRPAPDGYHSEDADQAFLRQARRGSSRGTCCVGIASLRLCHACL